MNFFTAIFEYKGGTYTYQFYSKSGIDDVDVKIISSANAKIRKIIDHYHKKENIDPTPLDGLENVWCQGFIYKGSLVLINFVLTREDKIF